MPNFKITWQTGVREKAYTSDKMDGLLFVVGEFVRVLVAPDQELMTKIAQAMLGENRGDVAWHSVLHKMNEGWSNLSGKASPSQLAGVSGEKSYELVLSSVLSIEETQEAPFLGDRGDHPIPNDQYVWQRHVAERMGWAWSSGVTPIYATAEKNYRVQEIIKIDGLVTSSHERTSTHFHMVGVVEILRGEWHDYEGCRKAVKATYERLGITMPS
ncbi:MAG: hypothetical protein AAB638_02875 [Patescibacteria group bacterium]